MVPSRPPSSGKSNCKPSGQTIEPSNEHERKRVCGRGKGVKLRPARGCARASRDARAIRIRHGPKHIGFAHHSARLRPGRNATWFVYLLATASMLLVGFCVSRFAQLALRPGRSIPTLPTPCRRSSAPPLHGACCSPISLPAHPSQAARSTTRLCSCSSSSIGRRRCCHIRHSLRIRSLHRLSRRQALGRSDAWIEAFRSA